MLSRPHPANPLVEKVLAANVDLVIAVGSVGTPPFRPGLIDRILIAAARGGTDVLLCVNKCDLGIGEEDRNALATYSDLRVIFCSTETGEGLQELREAIRGRTCVFAGHSGVGKSSLANALCPTARQATGATGKLKGKHTTSSSSLLV
ncbi:MAG: GTPase RsgA [Bryobacteraceae bacterium]